MLRLKEKYVKEVIPAMQKKFGYQNKMAVPMIKKVTINSGFGKMIAGKNKSEQKKIYESILNDIALIAGQKPVLTKAKKSISGFNIRQGTPIGLAVTLRGGKMYDFLERLIYIALPRTRDFHGIKYSSFDKIGNLTIGVKEHFSFPEVSLEKTKTIFGFEITITMTAKNKEECVELFKLLGFPIKR